MYWLKSPPPSIYWLNIRIRTCILNQPKPKASPWDFVLPSQWVSANRRRSAHCNTAETSQSRQSFPLRYRLDSNVITGSCVINERRCTCSSYFSRGTLMWTIPFHSTTACLSYAKPQVVDLVQRFRLPVALHGVDLDSLENLDRQRWRYEGLKISSEHR